MYAHCRDTTDNVLDCKPFVSVNSRTIYYEKTDKNDMCVEVSRITQSATYSGVTFHLDLTNSRVVHIVLYDVGIYQGAFINPPVSDNIIAKFPTIFTNDGFNRPVYSSYPVMQPNNIFKVIHYTVKKAYINLGRFRYTGTANTFHLNGHLYICSGNTDNSYWRRKYDISAIAKIRNKTLQYHHESMTEDTTFKFTGTGGQNIDNSITMILMYGNDTSSGDVFISISYTATQQISGVLQFLFVPTYVCQGSGGTCLINSVSQEPIDILRCTTANHSYVIEYWPS